MTEFVKIFNISSFRVKICFRQTLITVLTQLKKVPSHQQHVFQFSNCHYHATVAEYSLCRIAFTQTPITTTNHKQLSIITEKCQTHIRLSFTPSHTQRFFQFTIKKQSHLSTAKQKESPTQYITGLMIKVTEQSHLVYLVYRWDFIPKGTGFDSRGAFTTEGAQLQQLRVAPWETQ